MHVYDFFTSLDPVACAIVVWLGVMAGFCAYVLGSAVRDVFRRNRQQDTSAPAFVRTVPEMVFFTPTRVAQFTTYDALAQMSPEDARTVGLDTDGGSEGDAWELFLALPWVQDPDIVATPAHVDADEHKVGDKVTYWRNGTPVHAVVMEVYCDTHPYAVSHEGEQWTHHRANELDAGWLDAPCACGCVNGCQSGLDTVSAPTIVWEDAPAQHIADRQARAFNAARKVAFDADLPWNVCESIAHDAATHDWPEFVVEIAVKRAVRLIEISTLPAYKQTRELRKDNGLTVRGTSPQPTCAGTTKSGNACKRKARVDETSCCDAHKSAL